MSSSLPARIFMRPHLAFVWLLMGTASAMADDYSAGWGPQVGSQLPVLEAYDQDGTLRNLENLSGERGLLLFLNRSADW